ncbi:DNA topoisomerase 3 [Candidatus Igneacidithiobacillus taiwanensis]|uniref:DNA topoisomerase 3 n=1 Tax=Candidatus Igneacidithiobacillus taiwanensis TaxID=1945924 RepID=UPI00289D9485|nr:DNA topoisomerase 3 [Candidatus Igneacidithiobacillus taiwanensis]
MKLYIAEKPSLGKGIAEYLPGTKSKGSGYIQCGSDTMVTWCFGHIFEQEDPDFYTPDTVPVNPKGKKKWRFEELPIFPEQWQRRAKEDAKKQIKVIRDLLKKATVVVNAGDPDREGQLLVDEVLEELGWKGKTERIWLAALDEQSVKKALGNLKDNHDYRNLRDSAEARSRADWLMGMNLTRAFTVRNSGSGTVSVGRVQTPTLALVVARDEKIEKFQPKDYFVPRIHAGFWAAWELRENAPGVDGEGYLTDRKAADALMAKAQSEGKATVKDYSSTEKSQQAPLGFSLAELQKVCSARLGMSAQQVLDAAQALYEEHKATTYPRTDCRYLPEEQHGEAGRVLAGLAKLGHADLVKGADAKRKSAIWNTGKVTAHHAIIPTGAMQGSMSPVIAKVYEIIVRSYLAQFYSPYVYRATKVVLACAAEDWKATANVPVSAGWKAVYGMIDEEEDDAPQPIPTLQKGQSLPVQAVDVQAKQTKPPSRFTDGSLIEAMSNIHKFIEDEEAKKKLKETSGLGTEATRANTIETLLTRGFLERKGKQIISSQAGRALVHALPTELTDPVLTARWEDALAGVAEGRVSLADFEALQRKFVARMVETAKSMNLSIGEAQKPGGGQGSPGKGRVPPKAGPMCPSCKKATVALKMKSGGVFYKCEGCQSCWGTDKQDAKKLGQKWGQKS